MKGLQITTTMSTDKLRGWGKGGRERGGWKSHTKWNLVRMNTLSGILCGIFSWEVGERRRDL